MPHTRPFDNELDRYLVVSSPTVSPLPDVYRSLLRPLTSDGAVHLWNDVVTRRGRPLTRLLPRSHWSRQFSAIGPDWMTAWNAWLSGSTDDIDPVRMFLSSAVQWEGTELIYFILSGQSAFSLPWGPFLASWHYFLHTDQDALVVIPANSQFVCFGETGILGVGSRPL